MSRRGARHPDRNADVSAVSTAAMQFNVQDGASGLPGKTKLAQAAFVCGLIFLLSVCGIFTRPIGFLASFWPANAVLLGLMVRFPTLCTTIVWISAFVGYFAADLITGGQPLLTLWLTTANLAGAGIGVILFRFLPIEDRRLLHPASMLFLLVICTISGFASAVVGAGTGPAFFEKDWFIVFWLWFAMELVNDLLLVPVILTFPSLKRLYLNIALLRNKANRGLLELAPLVALVASMILTQLVGGPGAIAFIVPALLWCALSYNMFSTSLLTLSTCFWLMAAVAAGTVIILPVSTDPFQEAVSLRLGVAFLALGPLTAASIGQSRNELVQSLNHAVNHDFLTDALARKAFMEEGAIAVENPTRESSTPAVMMLDIDRFKSVNDAYGHKAGDEVLVAFAKKVSQLLRRNDLFGRMGGEEFAIILPRVEFQQAKSVAERIRAEVESMQVVLSDGRILNVTVSIGLAFPARATRPTLKSLLFAADTTLYRAKTSGRNRVESIVLKA